MSIFKLSIIVEDEAGQAVDAFNFDSSTALEEHLEKLQQNHLIIQQQWLHVVTLVIKRPPHENPLLKELGPEAFEEPVEEVFTEEIEEESEEAIPCADPEEKQDPENDSEIPW